MMKDEKNTIIEYIDILDENGIFTGKIATRQEVYKLGLWHRIVLVAIISKERKVLLQQRQDNKKIYPGMWDISVGGHIDSGEDTISAAMREVVEEVGIYISPTSSADVFRYMTSYRFMKTFENGMIDNQFDDVFILELDSYADETEIKFQKDEVKAIKWVSLSELEQLIKNDTSLVSRSLYAPLIEYLSKH
ncbi:MAG: NUDIX domain-containing protein [Clostridia bacterium]|nr:NUDIX domain-containing protein [Clostridia bacterium]